MKLNKLFILIFLITMMLGCRTPSYNYSMDSSSYGVEFRKGKWLMNNIDAPYSLDTEITEIAKEKFGVFLGDNLYLRSQVSGIAIPGETPINPDKEYLQSLRTGTGFDYFINIKSQIVHDEIGSIQIGKIYGKAQNRAEVIVQIYDLKSLDIIYNQRIVGSISVENDNKDFALSTSSKSIVLRGFKKIMNKMEKHSTKE